MNDLSEEYIIAIGRRARHIAIVAFICGAAFGAVIMVFILSLVFILR